MLKTSDAANLGNKPLFSDFLNGQAVNVVA